MSNTIAKTLAILAIFTGVFGPGVAAYLIWNSSHAAVLGCLFGICAMNVLVELI